MVIKGGISNKLLLEKVKLHPSNIQKMSEIAKHLFVIFLLK